MPRPSTRRYWVERIRVERANDPKKGAEAIARELRGKEKPDDPAPSERTVQRYILEFENLPESEKKQYRRVVWPESFESAGDLLPWAAAPAVFELWNHNGERPTVRHAMWFWRTTLANPEMPIEQRAFMALVLDKGRMLSDPSRVWREFEKGLSGRDPDFDAREVQAEMTPEFWDPISKVIKELADQNPSNAHVVRMPNGRVRLVRNENRTNPEGDK